MLTIGESSVKTPRAGMSVSKPLGIGLIVYLVLAIALSYCQRGRINADFIGYATVAHRLLQNPAASISGHWSPLFSWLMAGLIRIGVPDLIAGRAILVAAGAIFILCLYRIACRFRSGDAGPDRFLVLGTLTCATVQALCWSIYLLDPDLLAAALFFIYADFLLDSQFASKRGIVFAAGIAAGLSYLSKAYMFPFILVHFPITLAMRRRSIPPGKLLVSGIIVFAALMICVGPWAAVLSNHFHRFTVSTAGASNHANVSPENDGLDKLFAPGLVPDYILDPHLSPDWSPFQDWPHFRHQLALVGKNTNVLVGHFGPWLLMVLIAFGLWGWARKSGGVGLLQPPETFAIAWCLMTFVVYCSGYALLVVEARYVVPVGAPLLCIAAILLVRSIHRAQNASPARLVRWLRNPQAYAVVIVTLFFSCQQIQRLAYSAVFHAQTRDVNQLRPIAAALEQFVPTPLPMACNHWHDGLAVAFLSNRIQTYYGSPATLDWPAEMKAAHIRVYLRLVERPTATSPIVYPDLFVPPGPWELTASIDDPALSPWTAEIYTLNPVKIPRPY